VRAQTQINTIKVVVKYRIILLVEPLKRKTLITILNSKIIAYECMVVYSCFPPFSHFYILAIDLVLIKLCGKFISILK